MKIAKKQIQRKLGLYVETNPHVFPDGHLGMWFSVVHIRFYVTDDVNYNYSTREAKLLPRLVGYEENEPQIYLSTSFKTI